MHTKHVGEDTIWMSDSLAGTVDVSKIESRSESSDNFLNVGKMFSFQDSTGIFEAQAVELSKKKKNNAQQFCLKADTRDAAVLKRLFNQEIQSVSFFCDGIKIVNSLPVIKVIERKIEIEEIDLIATFHVTMIFE